MKKVRLAPAARRDVQAIWPHTAKAWSIGQADSYVTGLHNDMARLLDFPGLGSPHTIRLGNFRKLPSGHHLIFYIVGDAGVEIVRVLHERADYNALIG